MKRNTLAAIAAATLAALAAQQSRAADQLRAVGGGYPFINSQLGSNQTTVAKGTWPLSIPTSTTITNITPIPVSPTDRYVALQFTCLSTNATATSNITVTLARGFLGSMQTNLLGGAPLDSNGNALAVEPAFITWTFALNGSTAVTYCTNFNQLTQAKGGTPFWYVWSIGSTTAVAGLTNYQMYAVGYQ